MFPPRTRSNRTHTLLPYTTLFRSNLSCARGQRELSRRCNHPVLDTATQRTAAARKKIHLADSASNLSQHLTDDSVVAETIACANRIVKPLARTRDEIGRASCRERVWQ